MNEFKYGWKSLLAATIGTMCGIFTLTNYSQGFFVGPVTSEFGWSPPQFFLSYTVLMCCGLFTGPLIGSIAQKRGLRVVGIAGLIGHSLGYILLSFNNGSLMNWYLNWALIAILGAGSLPIVWTGVLNNWFVKHRGKAIGVTMAGTGLGAFLLPPLVEFLISNYGWRTAYQGIGLGALLVSMPIVIALFKEKPDTDSAGETQVAENKVATWGMTSSEAMRTSRFWILGAVLFFTVIVIAGLLSNFERIMSEQGFERSSIAQIAAIMGLTVVVGRLLVGVLVDRFWAPGVAGICLAVPAVGVFLLHGEQSLEVALLASFMIGFAAGAELDLMAFLAARYFGLAHYAKIYSVLYATLAVCSGTAPMIFASAYDLTGSYDIGYLIALGLFLLSAVMVLFLGPYPKGDSSPPAGSN